MWRNNVQDGYKIDNGYTTRPVDFSNYLLLRTRERFLLSNRVDAPHLVLQSGKPSYLSGPTSAQALTEVEKDTAKHLAEFSSFLEILDISK